MPRPLIRVDGLRNLSRELGGVKEAVGELKSSMRRIGDFVIQRSVPRTRRRTGRLASSYRASRTKAAAIVRNRLIYAPVQEFGWPKQNITPSLAVIDTISRDEDDIVRLIETELDDIARRFRP